MKTENIYKLSEDWGELIERAVIVPFGLGRIGRRIIPTLMKEFKIPFLIDNSCQIKTQTDKIYQVFIYNCDGQLIAATGEYELEDGYSEIYISKDKFELQQINGKEVECYFEDLMPRVMKYKNSSNYGEYEQYRLGKLYRWRDNIE